MNGRVFATMRDAINHAATRSGKSQKEIAGELDWSPTMLSLATTLGEENARPFPCDDAHLVRMMAYTGDHSPLLTLADKLGYELVPRRDRTAEMVAALTQTVQGVQKTLEQLSLGLDGGQGSKRK
jgi:hypothetical protein